MWCVLSCSHNILLSFLLSLVFNVITIMKDSVVVAVENACVELCHLYNRITHLILNLVTAVIFFIALEWGTCQYSITTTTVPSRRRGICHIPNRSQAVSDTVQYTVAPRITTNIQGSQLLRSVTLQLFYGLGANFRLTQISENMVCWFLWLFYWALIPSFLFVHSMCIYATLDC